MRRKKCSRHDAIHLLGAILLHYLAPVLDRKKGHFELDSYLRLLKKYKSRRPEKIMPARSFDEISVQDWDETIRVNLSGAFYWCRQVVPDMKANEFGRIVNISSIAARAAVWSGPTMQPPKQVCWD